MTYCVTEITFAWKNGRTVEDTKPGKEAGTSLKRPLHTWGSHRHLDRVHGPGHGDGAERHRGRRPRRQGRPVHLPRLLHRHPVRRLRLHRGWPRKITHAGSVYALAGITLGPRAGFFGGFALLGTYIFFAACILGACAVFFEAMLSEIGITMAPGMWMIVALVVGVIALALNLRESATVARTRWASASSASPP